VKHSVGRWLDQIVMAQATGVAISSAAVDRAVKKRKTYANRNSEAAVQLRRRNRPKKKEFRNPQGTVAYKGQGKGLE
jgi:hypothetical protein